MTIRVHTAVVDLPAPGVPPCLLQLTLLDSQAMVWVGQAGAEARLGADWSAAMPGSTSSSDRPATSTSLSRTTNNDLSLAMSKRLARRFQQPVFLSIDVPFLNSQGTGVSEEMAGRWSLMLEKQIVASMQEALTKGDSTRTPPQAAPIEGGRTELQGEMVGR